MDTFSGLPWYQLSCANGSVGGNTTKWINTVSGFVVNIELNLTMNKLQCLTQDVCSVFPWHIPHCSLFPSNSCVSCCRSSLLYISNVVVYSRSLRKMPQLLRQLLGTVETAQCGVCMRGMCVCVGVYVCV